VAADSQSAREVTVHVNIEQLSSFRLNNSNIDLATEFQGARNKDGERATEIIIVLSMEDGDVERLKKAFDEGKLKSLGIVAIDFEPQSPDSTKANWQQSERRKRRTKRDDDAPKL
jgi:hypothetical protein